MDALFAALSDVEKALFGEESLFWRAIDPNAQDEAEKHMTSGITTTAVGDTTEKLTSQSGPSLFIPVPESVPSLIDAVHWDEPFVISLIFVQLAIAALCLFALRRGSSNCQTLLFLVIASLGWGSKHFNEIAERHWTRLTRQNYFGSDGFFVAVFWAGPLLFWMTVLVIAFLCQLAQLLAIARRGKMREIAKSHKIRSSLRNRTASTEVDSSTKFLKSEIMGDQQEKQE